MNRILLTGGAGFIGSHVAEVLLKRGYDVMIIDNLSSLGARIPRLQRLGHGFRRWDILDLKLMDVIFHNFEPEAVIHLAAQPSIQTSWKAVDFDAQTNIIGTINLLGLCQRYKVKRFVFASTSAVYAPHKSRAPYPYEEDDLVDPQTPYGVSKAAAEYYIQISGLSYAILRLGNVYGPGQVPLGENQLIPRALAHIYQGEPFVINGDGKQSRDFIYVEDVADAFVKAAEKNVTAVLNIAGGMSLSINYALEMLYNFTRSGDWIPFPFISFWKHGPSKAGELQDVCLSNHLAKGVLDWEPTTSMRDGLKKTIKAWSKE